MIPKVIHYCWFGGKPLPGTARKCLASWQKMCPDYEIKRWDETNFDVHQHPFVASAYDAGAWAFVSDWARLKILLANGGIYLDTDVRLLKSLDSLLDNSCYVGIQQSEHLCNTGLGFGCVKTSPVVQAMLKQYDDIEFSWGKSKEIACPNLNDRVIRGFGYLGDGMGDVEHLDGLTVYPCRYLDPIAPGDCQDLTCAETVSISLYANSWGSWRDRVRRQALNAVGADKISKLKRILHGQAG